MQPFRNYRRPLYRQAPEIQGLIGRCSPPPATSAGEQREILNVSFQFPRHLPRDFATGSKSGAPGTRCLTPPLSRRSSYSEEVVGGFPADVFATPPTFPELRRPSRGQAPGARCITFAVSGPSLPGFPLSAGGCKSQAPGTRCSTLLPLAGTRGQVERPDTVRGLGAVLPRISAGLRSGLKVKHRVPGA